MKRIVKSILRWAPIEKRIKGYYAVLEIEKILRGFIDNNGWILSQPKTGTNYICSILAFYNAECLGLTGCNFGDRYRLGLVHGERITKSSVGITEALEFHRHSTRMLIVRTHNDVPNARPKL